LADRVAGREDGTWEALLMDAIDFGQALKAFLVHLNKPGLINERRLKNSDFTLLSLFSHVVESEKFLLQEINLGK